MLFRWLWSPVQPPFGQWLQSLPHAVIVAAVLWSLAWKGLALWRSARAGQTVWYVVLLVVNTVGLLEIAYLLFFVPRPKGDVHPT
jgi:methionyl-tRNA synthetase